MRNTTKSILLSLILGFLYLNMKLVSEKYLWFQILFVVCALCAWNVFSYFQKLQHESSAKNASRTFFISLLWIYLMLHAISIEWLDKKIVANVVLVMLPIPLLLVYRVSVKTAILLTFLFVMSAQFLAHGEYLLSAENFATATYGFLLYVIISQLVSTIKEDVLTAKSHV
jgi:hypothetical protein